MRKKYFLFFYIAENCVMLHSIAEISGILHEIFHFKEKTMKRLFTIGAVALVAAAFFGCSVVSEEEAPEYDALGRRLVKFSVPTRAYENHIGGGGSIRALSKDLAQSAWDYIEVVFKSGDDEYYVGTGVKGNDVHFALPAGTYQAVMFAGVAAGKKLLAVGVPTGVDGSDDDVDGQGSITIGTNTKRISFTLSALTADIKAGDLTIEGESAPAPAGLTFKIPTGTGLNSQTASAVDSENPPYFAVPMNDDEIVGTFRIGGFNDGDPVVGAPDDADLFNAAGLFGVLDAAGSTKIIQAIGVTGYDAETSTLITPVTVSGKVNAIGIEGGVLAIGFELATNVSSLNEGFSKIWFDVPIQAFNDSGAAEAGRGSVWHIVNGLEATYDRGGDSMERNILLNAKIVKKYYVSALGDDTWDGKTPETAFATLAKADPDCERIVVLTDLEKDALVTLDGTDAVNTNVITIKGALGTEEVTKGTGSTGSVITIQGGAKIAFKHITFKGIATNDTALITVAAGGKLVLQDGAVITGNTSNYNGGVFVNGGEFEMSGGKISGNTAVYDGVVFVNNAVFEMSGGVISGNTAGRNGGVFVNNAVFEMSGGVISGNTAGYGGGVYVCDGEFEMSSGVISGNTAGRGGGVFVNGGTISGNNASENGGGVFVNGKVGMYINGGTFTKATDSSKGSTTSGVIYGYTAGSALSNWVGTRKADGMPDTYVEKRGDVVWYLTDSKYRDGTLGENDPFSESSSPWDN
jgi:hypothetical protein